MTSSIGGPLTGVRVVHLASLGPGPYGAMLLADMGADVTVVDRVPALPGSVPPEKDPRRRGQRSIAVDLKSDDGLRLVHELVDRADVLIEGMRPGVATKLGVGAQTCLERNPRLIYASMTGWGQEGPSAHKAGHDINYVAATGALHAMGGTDPTPPPVPLNLLGDYAGGGAFLALQVIASLWQRHQTGRGSILDVAIVDGVASLTAATLGMKAAGLWRERGANAFDGSKPWYRTYATKDGGYVAVGAIESKFYAAMLEALGMDPAAWARDDGLDEEALAAELGARFAAEPRDHWSTVFDRVDACVSPVLSFDEALRSPAALARESYLDIDGVPQPAPLPRTGGSRVTRPGSPPAQGRDTRSILLELGHSEAEVAAMSHAGFISQGDEK
ncbi:CaiB/BaiF CoA transferase family protein [Gordonia terrae]